MHCKTVLLSSLYLGSIYMNMSTLSFLNKKNAFENKLFYINLGLFGLSGLALVPLTIFNFLHIIC